MHAIRLALLLFVGSSLFASPVITSIAPVEGPLTGGTRVVIRGSGFSDNCIICSPPFGGLRVLFGETEALDVDLIDPTRIEAVTPPHLPGPVPVTVTQLDGSEPNHFTVEAGFRYLGEGEVGSEVVLFPIFMPPIRGAFGSEFVTSARVASRGEPLDLYGVDTNCTLIDPPILPSNPYRVNAGEQVLYTGCSQSVGRLFYVSEGRAGDLVANLRVADITRSIENFGVEIPVVRGEEFTTARIVLLGVPLDPRFRNTLRIYGLPGGTQQVNVTVNGVTHTVSLQPGRDAFEPSFATFTSFPASLPTGPALATVTIEDPLGGRGIVPATRVWAMISVTNNATQQITTITPN